MKDSGWTHGSSRPILESDSFPCHDIREHLSTRASALEGLTVLVTGATRGIGLATVRQLAAGGAVVLVHGRDGGRVAEVVEALRRDGGQADGVVADLASLGETLQLARRVAERVPRLDALVNNAGLGPGSSGGRRAVSRDGHELLFAVNYLAHYALVRELARHGLPRRAIVNVSSIGQAPIDFDDPMLERRYDGWQAYCQSKLAMVMLTFDLAADAPAIAVTALHPGTYLDTDMVREMGVQPLGKAEDGGRAVVALLERSLAGGVSGRYFDVSRPAEPDAQASDPAARRRLRELSDPLVARAGG